jgi:histidinol-phosphatase (PHP family)
MPFRFDWDGHVHSGFCPHGSGESTRARIERAIELGFRRISIIEHYPLPPGFPPPPTSLPVDLPVEDVEPYLDETLALRKEFAGRIEVLVGFEWDFLPRHLDWMRGQLEEIGPRTQDGIMSIHFLKGEIIDATAEHFMRRALPLMGGTLEGAYSEYYRTLMQAVETDLGEYKPRRIGHLNLIRRFQRLHAAPGEYRDEIIEIVKRAAEKGMQLDYNVSGLRREHCGEAYVPSWLVEKIAKGEIEIECVYGSDAHSVGGIGASLEEARRMAEQRE